jgi:hypothetical protein
VVVVLLGERQDRAMKRSTVTLLLAIALVGCGGVNPADAPPAGTVWFGQSLDAKTLAITGRSTTLAMGTAGVMVANLGKSMKPEDVMVRVTFDGAVVNNERVKGSGNAAYWGIPITSLPAAGDWLFEFVDAGGAVLATGTLTVT